MRWDRIRSKLGSWLSTMVLVISVIICLTVVVQVSTNRYVQIGGYSLFKIITGSMGETIPEGSVILCRDTDIREIEEGDIVCFLSENPQVMGKVVTHRVCSITISDDGLIQLETKGDANLTADRELVTEKNLIGKVYGYEKDKSVMLMLVDVLTDKIGFLILILFPTLLIAGFVLRSCIKNMKKEIENAINEEQQIKKAQLYSEEEYAEMLQRIKNEVAKELEETVEEGNAEAAMESSKTE